MLSSCRGRQQDLLSHGRNDEPKGGIQDGLDALHVTFGQTALLQASTLGREEPPTKDLQSSAAPGTGPFPASSTLGSPDRTLNRWQGCHGDPQSCRHLHRSTRWLQFVLPFPSNPEHCTGLQACFCPCFSILENSKMLSLILRLHFQYCRKW